MTVSEWIRSPPPSMSRASNGMRVSWRWPMKKTGRAFARKSRTPGKVIPMMCCSPDFTHPDAAFREKEIAKQKRWIDMTHTLGGSYCRVLSGQRRPELSIDEGVKLAAESIHACLPYAQERGITLIIENHYKDDFWEYPEFAQKMDVFCKLVDAIEHPNFGVNYDPSTPTSPVKIPSSC
jgi:sugar phosphate isomerase/epimerase